MLEKLIGGWISTFFFLFCFILAFIDLHVDDHACHLLTFCSFSHNLLVQNAKPEKWGPSCWRTQWARMTWTSPASCPRLPRSSASEVDDSSSTWTRTWPKVSLWNSAKLQHLTVLQFAQLRTMAKNRKRYIFTSKSLHFSICGFQVFLAH